MKKYIQNAKSWDDLNNTLSNFTKSNQSKLAGDIFEYLTKLYLETAPQYKSKLKKVYLLNEVPTSIKKKINLPDTDEGIDLIAVTNDDEYWAIQCKYRSDPNQTLTIKEDLATFNNLAFTYCKNISHGIVCATVSKPPKKIKLLKSIGFETLETWLALDDNDLFSQIKAKASGKVIKPKPLSPRPHQKAAIKKTREHFKSNERGKIIMPCGTGKSLTAFWIAREMGVKSILVAVPSLALLQQTLKVWTREFLINNVEPEWFCVCSDGTVKDEQDDYVTDTSDLGIKVETDPKQIKKFLKKKTSKIKVVFTTYQSGRATAKGSKGFTYDLGIMDEAHKTVGSKTKEMAHLLHQKNIKIKKRIFMTATERLFRGDSDEFMSMDDPRDYGSLIYELSFKEAINAKPPIISDYKIITFGITVPEIEQIAEDNRYLEVKKDLKDITARELATALALRKAIKKYNIKNAISFHRSIKRADDFRKQQQLISKIYPEYGKLKSFHVKGDMPTADRAVQMREFAKGKGLMTNARCLTEGVDLPAIDCVCFTDPKRSKVDIVQAAGRALRLAKDKKFGYILIPIFIPDGIDFNTAAEAQGFDDVAITVRALASTDKRIVEYLRVISSGGTHRGGTPVDGLTSANSLYKVEAEEFDKAIKLKVWDKVAYGNWRSYEEAKQYAQSLNLKSGKKWRNKSKINHPRDIPSHPEDAYSKEWEGWAKFLGNEIVYRSFKEAKNYVLSLKLKTKDDWSKIKDFKDFPKDIPLTPNYFYKREWNGWGDFLGTGRVANQKKIYRSFKEAKKYVQSLKFKNSRDWILFTKSKNFPDDLPKSPNNSYNKDWINWGDFLGIRSKNYRSFKEAKKYVQKLKLSNTDDWNKYCKKGNLPIDIPTAPHYTYKKEWKGMGDFLGTGFVANQFKKFRSYKETKKYAQSLKLRSKTEWVSHTKSDSFPKDIPANVSQKFKKEWEGWGIFLGTGFVATFLRKYKSYEESKKYVKPLKIRNEREWRVFTKSKNFPKDIPSNVWQYYSKRNKWVSWSDFLGKK